ncbi:MAG: hypothetical protein KDI68_14255 [Gammaproteobacteria bacterium]|nr:hypothetical protein [Gammaproteobacteria bacterium]
MAPKRADSPAATARIWLAILLCALFCRVSPADAGEPSPQPGRLRDLVLQVAGSDYAAQQDFAWIALSELTASYEQALAASAERLPQSQRARRKLYSWRGGAQEFVDELRRLLALLDGTADLRLRVDETGPPVLYVDRQPVVLSGPELGAAQLMEQRIFDGYCAIYDCSGLQPRRGRAPESSREPAGAAGRWWLEDYGRVSYRTGDGLLCRFREIAGRVAKQQACERIATELRVLAEALREAQLAGHGIDWRGLRIESLAAGRGQRLMLHPHGAYLRLPLPSLAAGGGLSDPLLQWLRQRVAGEEARAEIPRSLLVVVGEAPPR